MNKESMIYLFEWDDICEDLTDEEFGQMMRAVSKYAQTGEKPTFSDRTMKANFKSISKGVDRFSDKYKKQCERNRENGKKGGRPKKSETEKTQGNPSITQKNPPEPEREPEREPDPDRDPERGRGRGREPESAPADKGTPAADTTTTTTAPGQVLREWNDQAFTQRIKSVESPDLRWRNTVTAMQTAGGLSQFLDVIRDIDHQAYFQQRNEDGYQVEYDWFVNPDNFLRVVEGAYKEKRGKAKAYEGWEVWDG